MSSGGSLFCAKHAKLRKRLLDNEKRSADRQALPHRESSRIVDATHMESRGGLPIRMEGRKLRAGGNMMKREFLVLVLSMVVSVPLGAQDCGLSAEYSSPCNLDDGSGSGGGGGGSPCQYCYTAQYAPYGNCYSAAPGYGTGTLLAHCQGTRTCWTDGSGATYCEPSCAGYPCYMV